MTPTFLQPPQHLTDEAVQRFIRLGYLTLQSELPRSYHARMYELLAPLEENGLVGHNNLLPCVPELQQMLDEPLVRGAIESLLGEGYYLHFHRHDHVNFPDAAQPLHKDGDNHSHSAIDGLRRHHPTRFLMLFYYPQDTPLESGPTGIVPGSQYAVRFELERCRSEWRGHTDVIVEDVSKLIDSGESKEEDRRDLFRERYAELKHKHSALYRDLKIQERPWESTKIPLEGPAGTVTIAHFDLVHGRYAPNLTDQPRHLVKFLFTRNREPGNPSWQHEDESWEDSGDVLEPV